MASAEKNTRSPTPTDIKLVVCNKCATPLRESEVFSAKEIAGEPAKETIQIREQTNLERVALFSKMAAFRFPKYFPMLLAARPFSDVAND